MREYNNENNIDRIPLAVDSTMAVSDLEQKSDNFQRFVIRKFINLEIKTNRMDKKVDEVLKILKKVNISNVEMNNEENIDIFQELPLKDENHLQLMEGKLKNDMWYRNEMTKQLSRLTRDDLKATCVGLMRAVISNELAINYSWYGAKKKQVFSQLEICKVILNVIRKSYTDVTDEKISAPIKIWLAHDKERLGRRTEKIVAKDVTDN